MILKAPQFRCEIVLGTSKDELTKFAATRLPKWKLVGPIYWAQTADYKVCAQLAITTVPGALPEIVI